MIQEAGGLGALLQYHAEGYLPNKRQQRAAGLAIIEIAQRLRNGIWKNIKKNSGIQSLLIIFVWVFDFLIFYFFEKGEI